MRRLALCLFACTAAAPCAHAQCIVADNGFGTATMPPVGCTYLTPDGDMQIVNGLAAGDTIQIDARIEDFAFINEVNGGTLGGTRSQFSAQLVMVMTGTGGLNGFQRQITMLLPNDGSNLIDCAPRVPFANPQAFDTEMFSLRGELFGDPDFCELRVRAGMNQGLPSPGATVMGSMPANTWQVDSFFDVVYQIDFQGCPGSIIEGLSGTTTDEVRFTTDLCPADLNNDGVVDTADLGILIGAFGGAGPLGDLNGDGVVDTADLGILIGQFGQVCFPT